MSNGNSPTHLTNLKDARSYIGKLERDNAALRHDLERCMTRELALLNSQSDAATEQNNG